MPDGSNLIIGRNNTATSTTTLSRSGGISTVALNINNDSGVGISAGSPDNIGVIGASENDDGVRGESRRAAGVEGNCEEGPGVFGSSQLDVGVYGRSNTSVGIFGQTMADTSAGIFADVTGDSAGVWGVSRGRSTWPAVEGYSLTATGVRGVSLAPVVLSFGNTGVVGYSKFGGGVLGWTDSLWSWGGAFHGGLVVWGGPKSAAVPHPDGSHRLLYCVESPESWFEDFGRAKLVRGGAKIKLDVNFAAVIRTDNYHVFLCAEGRTKGLYVSRRDRVGFEVRKHEDGTSRATFSYRVVARRKDIKSPRFRKVVLPRISGEDLQKTPTGIKISKRLKARKAVRRFSTIKKSRHERISR